MAVGAFLYLTVGQKDKKKNRDAKVDPDTPLSSANSSLTTVHTTDRSQQTMLSEHSTPNKTKRAIQNKKNKAIIR